MENQVDVNYQSQPDNVLVAIADYVLKTNIESDEAYNNAYYGLLDTLGCGFLALRFPECAKHLGPVVHGTLVPNGARVPGTSFILDPIKAAFDIGCIIRWLDFNDTWLAAEWGHPSDNLGGILAMADYLSHKNLSEGKQPLKMKDVLTAMIKAHEIQGITALENSFNRVGLDHVLLVRLATAAVVAGMLGANHDEVVNAVSHAWVDGSSLRTYRHAPNAGSRKSWAAGDATSRGVRLAMMAKNGEMGIPSVLSAKKWGFYDVSFGGNPLVYKRPFQSYVMENVLFKISYPAEFHSQTALEAAAKLHPKIKNRFDDIETIQLETHESAIRIISKTGKLNNYADRDHCLQYIVAIGLIFGDLKAEHYEDETASMPLIDALRDKMIVSENEQFTREYLEEDKRSIANSVQIFFKDGTKSEKVTVEYPVGHRRRRSEGFPLLMKKFEANVASRFPSGRKNSIMELCADKQKFMETTVNKFMDLLVI